MHHAHAQKSCSDHDFSENEHHKMMVADFKKRFWISLVLTVPVLLLSPMIQMWFGFTLQFPTAPYIAFLFATIIYFYGGWPFLTGLVSELKNNNPGMMTLIGFAISIAYFYSTAVVLGLAGQEFFWELATLIDIMLLGHWLEMKSVLGASRALELLVHLMPAQAHLVKENHIEEVNVEKLRIGDIILIKPGEKIPADGTIIEGTSYVDESMLTGESKPVKKMIGSAVIGGSMNSQGSLKVKVKYNIKNSYLNKVIKLVRDAQKTKSKTQRLADKAARWLTLIAIVVGVITFIFWIVFNQSLVFALERMVTVMVISCPHALGVAIPLVIAISTALSAQKGLLIRNRTAFENSRKITVLLFDKTGTLTQGKFSLTRYESLSPNYSKMDILKFAAALEQYSEHPIAAGVMRAIKELNMTPETATQFNALPGEGIEAVVGGHTIKIISPSAAQKNGIEISKNVSLQPDETTAFVLVDNTLAGFIALADQIRPESFEAVKTLKQHHIRVYMLTGDNKFVAQVVSEKLGLDGFFAEVLPHQKLEIIKDFQHKNEFVAMAGDGINDAPALAQADVGIAVGSGTDIAAETADIILVDSNPKDIATLILFGKATYKKMIQNLAWATGYNAFAIPIAAGILYYPLGIMLSPALGAVLMSLSTIIVAINAQLLRYKLK